MIKRIQCLCLPFLALVLSGCQIIEAELNAERIRGTGRVVQEKREVSGFTEVRLASVGELSLAQGDRESLTIEAEDNILPRIRTDVEGGALVIRTERGVSISPTVTVRYTLTVRELSGLELSGSGKIKTGTIRSQDFKVRLPGSGDIRIDGLTADSLTAVISGSGSINVPGKVVRQEVRISGSGDYDATNLQSQSGNVRVSGSGDCTLWIENDLAAAISGSGRVDYYGNPKVTQHISGSGKVRNVGDHP